MATILWNRCVGRKKWCFLPFVIDAKETFSLFLSENSAFFIALKRIFSKKCIFYATQQIFAVFFSQHIVDMRPQNSLRSKRMPKAKFRPIIQEDDWFQLVPNILWLLHSTRWDRDAFRIAYHESVDEDHFAGLVLVSHHLSVIYLRDANVLDVCLRFYWR